MSQGLRLSKNSRLILVSHDNRSEVANYIAAAAKELGILDLLFIRIPQLFRPMNFVPNPMLAALSKADAVIYFADRMPEEDYRFNRPLIETCRANRVVFCYLYDPLARYLSEGIAADYEVVETKSKRVANILREARLIEVNSDAGTHLEFSLYDTVLPRGPIYSHETNEPLQSPEGEVTSVPVEASFNGRLVANHTITSVGVPPSPVIWTFEGGRVTTVEGDNEFLSTLLETLKRSDDRIKSLKGMWIAEFSIGTNDWAVLDSNISNCEKVSGALHFGIGQTFENIGTERGEKFHFDSMVTNASVVTMKKDGSRAQIVEKGRLMV